MLSRVKVRSIERPSLLLIAAHTPRGRYFHEQGRHQSPDVSHPQGLKPGPRPTLLYGCGGFNVSLTPYFSVGRAVWLEQGGIYAIANFEVAVSMERRGIKREPKRTSKRL